MAAIPYPDVGELYSPWATVASYTATNATATVTFHIVPDTCASTYPYWERQPAEFVPGRRQPVWPDEPRVAKRSILQQPVAKRFFLRHKVSASSRCQVQRQKRKMRIQNMI